MDPEFDRNVLALAEGLFDGDEIETLCWHTPDVTVVDSPIKVIHKPTGLEAESDAYATQIRNKAAALLHLRQQLDARADA